MCMPWLMSQVTYIIYWIESNNQNKSLTPSRVYIRNWREQYAPRPRYPWAFDSLGSIPSARDAIWSRSESTFSYALDVVFSAQIFTFWIQFIIMKRPFRYKNSQIIGGFFLWFIFIDTGMTTAVRRPKEQVVNY